MVVTLAVYSKEVDAATRLLQWINEIGGCHFHTLVLATTQMVDPRPLLEIATKGWGSVEQFTIHAPNEIQPWPMGANSNFVAVCQYMHKTARPFFYMECDVLPLRPDWLNILDREYQTCGKPFMGCVHSMIGKSGEKIGGSEHMNGAGIYPAQVLSYLPTLSFVAGAFAGQMASEPWDVALRWETLYLVDGNGGFRRGDVMQPGFPHGRVSACHATQLICFCWRSGNFRWENDQLLYDLSGTGIPNRLDLSRHVLHHGCKDDSLMRLMRDRLFPPAPPRIEPQRALPPPQPPVQQEPPNPEPAAVAAARAPEPPPRTPAFQRGQLPVVAKKTPGRKKAATKPVKAKTAA